ncbi:MAG TPA: hypothetical protein GXX19_11310 [Syntrophomonadaceae bacterium]|nr:hypothetical protein [Syntrophomonadaceae bacterium]
MCRLRQCKPAVRIALFLALLLCAAITSGGCGDDAPVFNGRAASRDRLVVYEKGGYVWVVEASGEKARKIGETGNLRLGPPAPDGRRMAVLTGVSRNGEWLSGYAAVLSLNGRLKPVVGPQGPLLQEPGEVAWVGNSLVLASLDSIWIAGEEGRVFRAKALYTTRSSGSERVWYPRAVPGGREISFWITSNEGEESLVRARLVTLSVRGGTTRAIFTETIWAGGEAPVDVLWSQDGKYALVYCEPAGGGNCWWLLDGETGARKAVLSPEAGDPQWLPGSKAIVYAPRAALQLPDYEVLDVLTGKKHPFAGIPNWVTWLEVSPDGKMLLLARAAGDDGLKYDLYTASVGGTNIKKIAEGAGDAFWQP